jgi:hypothetical protein
VVFLKTHTTSFTNIFNPEKPTQDIRNITPRTTSTKVAVGIPPSIMPTSQNLAIKQKTLAIYYKAGRTFSAPQHINFVRLPTAPNIFQMPDDKRARSNSKNPPSLLKNKTRVITITITHSPSHSHISARAMLVFPCCGEHRGNDEATSFSKVTAAFRTVFKKWL